MQTSKPPSTFISDLKPSSVATVEVTITKLDPIREVEQRLGGTTLARNVLLNDGTDILWSKDKEIFAEGQKIHAVDGWVKDCRGRPQISLGRSGKLAQPA